VSLHLIRESDVWHQVLTDLAPEVGGLVEFYRSPAREQWTPTGVQGKLGPVMSPERDAEYRNTQAEKDGNLAPQRKLANEKPQGETVDYDTLIKTWSATPLPRRAWP